MSGSQDSGMATASSTAAPKLRESSCAVMIPLPPKKMTLHMTRVSTNSSTITTWLMRPKSVRPIRIQTKINAPITRHHSQAPTPAMPFAASAPS